MTSSRRKSRSSFDEQVGILYVWIADRFVGNRDLRAARAAAGFGAEGLDERGMFAVIDGRGLADDHPAEDHALAAEAADTDFSFSAHCNLARRVHRHFGALASPLINTLL